MSLPGEPTWFGYPPRPWPPPGWPGATPVLTAGATSGEPVRTYQRTLRVRTYRWWKPLVGVGLFVGVYLVVLVTLIVVPGVVVAALGDASQDSLSDDGSPGVFLLGNISLAALIPCAMLAVWAVHRIRPGFLSSVAGRIRWTWLLLCSGVAIVVVVLSLGASFFVPVDGGGDSAEVPLASAGTFLALAVVIVLTTPLQAAGEEYAFRGYLTQALGAWVRFPVVPILITSLLFAFAHGSQNLPLFLDRFVFGLVCGFLVLRTGGLEASIALHTFSNMVVLLLGAAYADFGDQLASTEAPWAALVFDGVQLVIYVAVIEAVRAAWVRRGRLTLTTGGSTGVPGA